MIENWKNIKGFSSYMVSDKGNVRSKPRILTDSFGRVYNIKGKMLSVKPWVDPKTKRNYYVKLKLVDDMGVTRNVSVHRLVAETFIPNPDNKPEVNHIDQDKGNNNVSNLEWVTKSENLKKCVVPGHNGSKNGNSRLTDNDVKNICTYLKEGKKPREIIKILQLPVKEECIYLIIHKKHWTHLKEVQELPDVVIKNKILTEEKVLKIREVLKNNPNLSSTQITKLLDFYVNPRTIRDIKSNRIYKYY